MLAIAGLLGEYMSMLCFQLVPTNGQMNRFISASLNHVKLFSSINFIYLNGCYPAANAKLANNPTELLASAC